MEKKIFALCLITILAVVSVAVLWTVDNPWQDNYVSGKIVLEKPTATIIFPNGTQKETTLISKTFTDLEPKVTIGCDTIIIEFEGKNIDNLATGFATMQTLDNLKYIDLELPSIDPTPMEIILYILIGGLVGIFTFEIMIRLKIRRII